MSTFDRFQASDNRNRETSGQGRAASGLDRETFEQESLACEPNWNTSGQESSVRGLNRGAAAQGSPSYDPSRETLGQGRAASDLNRETFERESLAYDPSRETFAQGSPSCERSRETFAQESLACEPNWNTSGQEGSAGACNWGAFAEGVGSARAKGGARRAGGGRAGVRRGMAPAGEGAKKPRGGVRVIASRAFNVALSFVLAVSLGLPTQGLSAFAAELGGDPSAEEASTSGADAQAAGAELVHSYAPAATREEPDADADGESEGKGDIGLPGLPDEAPTGQAGELAGEGEGGRGADGRSDGDAYGREDAGEGESNRDADGRSAEGVGGREGAGAGAGEGESGRGTDGRGADDADNINDAADASEREGGSGDGGSESADETLGTPNGNAAGEEEASSGGKGVLDIGISEILARAQQGGAATSAGATIRFEPNAPAAELASSSASAYEQHVAFATGLNAAQQNIQGEQGAAWVNAQGAQDAIAQGERDAAQQNAQDAAQETAQDATQETVQDAPAQDATSQTAPAADAQATLEPNRFAREGYRFIGWATTPDGLDAKDDPATAEDETRPVAVAADGQLMRGLSYTIDVTVLAYADGTQRIVPRGAAEAVAAGLPQGAIASSHEESRTFNLEEHVANGEIALYAQWAPERGDDASAPEGPAAGSDAHGIANAGEEGDAADQTDADQAAEAVIDELAPRAAALHSFAALIMQVVDSAANPDDPDDADTGANSDAASNLLAAADGDPADPATDPTDPTDPATTPQLDGTSIERFELRWLTADQVAADDGDADLLSLQPGTYEDQTMRYQLDLALSGDKQYEPGELEITIPATIWQNRGGSPVGSLSLPMPEEVDTRADFNYRRVGDSYVITNVRTLDSAGRYLYQFALQYVDPTAVKSAPAYANDLQATLQVVTSQGNVLETRTTNTLRAQMHTREVVTQARTWFWNNYAYGTYDDATAAGMPGSFAPENRDDYAYVRWYTDGGFAGNTWFDLSVSAEVGQYDGVVLGIVGGSRIYKADPASTKAEGVVFEGWDRPGNNKGAYIWTAYPKSSFTGDKYTYDLELPITWTVTEYDDNTQTTSASTTAKSVYLKPRTYTLTKAWSDNDDEAGKRPAEVSAWLQRVRKNTSDTWANWRQVTLKASEGWTYTFTDEGQIDYAYRAVESPVAPWYYAQPSVQSADGYQLTLTNMINTTFDYVELKGSTTLYDKWLYASSDHVLTTLRAGHEAEVPYTITGTSYQVEKTLAPGGRVDDPKTHNGTAMLFAVETGALQLQTLEDALTADDYEVGSITVRPPATYRFQTDSAATPDATWSSWGYTRDDTLQKPAVNVYALQSAGSGAGEWVLIATAAFDAAGEATLTLAASAPAGTAVDGATITLPQGSRFTQVRATAESTLSAVEVGFTANMRVHASSRVQPAAERAFDGRDYAMLTLTAPSNAYNARASAPDVITDSDTDVNGRRTNVPTIAWLHGRDVKVAASLSTGMQEVVEQNDTVHRRALIRTTATMLEQSNMRDSASYAQAIEDGYIPQDGDSSWYYLLPAGMVPQVDTVRLAAGDKLEEAYAIADWQGSGRYLLVVRAALAQHVTGGHNTQDPKSGLTGLRNTQTLTFDSWYSWDYLARGQKTVVGNVAFQSGDAFVGNLAGFEGEPDDPTVGNNRYSASATEGVTDLMTGLAAATGQAAEADPSFVYGTVSYYVPAIYRAATEITKLVSVGENGLWSKGLTDDEPQMAREGERYTYQLRVGTTTGTTRDIVLIDKLGAHELTSDDADYGSAEWKGTLLSKPDTSEFEALGCVPKVFYSTNADIDVRAGLYTNRIDDATGSYVDAKGRTEDDPDFDPHDLHVMDGWHEWDAEPPAGLSQVKAIAVDALRTASGPFELPEGAWASAYVAMRAPSGAAAQEAYEAAAAATTNQGTAYAFNVLHVQSSHADPGGTYVKDWGKDGQPLETDHTRVGLQPTTATVAKVWADDGNRDGKRTDSVKVHLYANGADTGRELVLSADETDDDGTWTGAFPNIPYADEKAVPYRYSIVEDTPEGYEAAVTLNAAGSYDYTVTNTLVPERISVSGAKRWEGDADYRTPGVADSFDPRPESVQVTLQQRIPGADEWQDVRTITVSAPANDEGDPDLAADEWPYSFDNLYKYAPVGQEMQYRVVEQDVPYTYTTATDGYDIVNTYHPVADLTVSKVVHSAIDLPGNPAFTFDLYLEDENGVPLVDRFQYTRNDASEPESDTLGNGDSFTLRDGEYITLKDLPDKARWRIEEARQAGFTANRESQSGTVRANADAAVRFDNTYGSSDAATLIATKALEGEALRAAAFTFTVTDVTKGSDREGEVVRQARNTASGAVTFGSLRYSTGDSGKTFTYAIAERIPDDAQNAAGTSWASASAAERAAGTWQKDGTVYDASTFTAQVVPTDHGDGTMTVAVTYFDADGNPVDVPAFANAYRASGSFAPKAYKSVPGRALADGQFAFELVDATDGSATEGRVLQTAQSDAAGEVAFEALEFTEADAGKTFAYIMREVVPDDARNAAGTSWADADDDERAAGGFAKDGISYAAGPLTITLGVEDNRDGTLSFEETVADENGDACDPLFENPQQPGTLTLAKAGGRIEDADLNTPFKFHVQLSGDALEDGQTFQYTVERDESLVGTSTNLSGASALAPAAVEIADIADAPSTTPDAPSVILDTPSVILSDSEESPALQPSATNDGGDPSTPALRASAQDDEGEPGSGPSAQDDEGEPGSGPSPVILSVAKNLQHSVQESLLALQGQSLEGALLQPEPASETGTPLAPQATTASGTSGTCVWELDEDGTLVIRPIDNVEGTLGTWGTVNTSQLPWGAVLPSVKAVDVQGTVHATMCYNMFYGMSNMVTANVANLDVSGVTDMTFMFYDCKSLEELDLSNWEANALQRLPYAFVGCNKLKKIDLFKASTGSLTSLSNVFGWSAANKSCPVLEAVDLTGLNTENVTTMYEMLWGCAALKSAKVDNLDVRNLKTMERTFAGCRALESLDLSSWHADSLASLYETFKATPKLADLKLPHAETGSLATMYSTFGNKDASQWGASGYPSCGISTVDLSVLNSANVTDMTSLFEGCQNLEWVDMRVLDTGKVTSFYETFAACPKLKGGDFSGMDVRNLKTMERTFASCGALESLDLSSWHADSLESLYETFKATPKLADLKLPHAETGSLATMYSTFGNNSAYQWGASGWPPCGIRTVDLSVLNTENVTNMTSLFEGCPNLEWVDMSVLKTGKVTGLYRTFAGCSKLKGGDFSRMDVRSVTTMQQTFASCGALESLDLSSWHADSLASLYETFKATPKLADLKLPHAETGSLATMYSTFGNSNAWAGSSGWPSCGITTIDLSVLNTENVTNMSVLFTGCQNISSIDMSMLRTGKVESFVLAFSYCPQLRDINVSTIDTSSATSMTDAFRNDPLLEHLDLSGFDTRSVANYVNWLTNDYRLMSIDFGPYFVASGGDNLVLVTNDGQMWYNEDATSQRSASNAFRSYYDGTVNAGTWARGRFVTFDANGGTGTMGSQTALYATTTASTSTRLVANAFTAPAGKKFGGWNTEPDGTGIPYNDQGYLRAIEWLGEPGHEIQLYAQWVDENAYRVNFNAGGGAGAKYSVWQSPNEDYTLPNGDGFYLFNRHVTGWRVSYVSNGRTMNLGTKDVGDVLAAGTVPEGATVTLTAVWAANDNTATVTDGGFDVELRVGERLSLDLPAGTTYKIYEETAEGWVLVDQQNPAGTIRATETSAATFTNDFDPYATSVSFVVTKNMNGLLAGDGSPFAFVLTQGERVIQQVNTVSGAGAVLFSPITYTQEGTYTYLVRELAGTDSTVSYDGHAELITVTVKREADRRLHATVEYSAGGAQFNNGHKPGSLTVTKQVTGDADALARAAADAFAVNVRLENPQAAGFPRTEKRTLHAGESFTLSGLPAGTAYTVTEDAPGTGWTLAGGTGLSGTVAADATSQATLVNAYAPPSVSATVRADKQFSGRGWDAGETVSFRLSGTGVPMPASDSGAVTAQVTAEAAGEGTLTASFAPITYTLDDLRDSQGVVQDSRTFRYVVSEVAPAGADAFGTLRGTTYDSAQHQVEVTVSRTAAGGLQASVSHDGEYEPPTFTNQYAAAPTGFAVDVYKELNGKALAAGVFRYDLYDDNADADDAGTTPGLADGTGEGSARVPFKRGDIVGTPAVGGGAGGAHSHADVTPVRITAAGTYHYVIRERIPDGAENADGTLTYSFAGDGAGVEATPLAVRDANTWTHEGVTYDSTPVGVTVVASDVDATGAHTGVLSTTVTYEGGSAPAWAGADAAEGAVLRNSYAATGTAQLKVAKHISGREWTDGDAFEFSLLPVDGAPLRLDEDGSTPGAVTAVATMVDRTPSFPTLRYELADLNGASEAVFTYTLHEVSSAASGMTLAADRPMKVKVRDDGAGALVVEYAAYDDATGALSDPLVWEQTVDAPDVTNVYTVSGEQKAVIRAHKAILNADGVDLLAAGWKTTDDNGNEHDFSGRSFSFALFASEADTPMPAGAKEYSSGGVTGRWVASTKPATLADPFAAFGEITYTKPGVYYYEIRELRDDYASAATPYVDGLYVKDDLVYSATAHAVRVTVRDTGTGTLAAPEVRYGASSTEPSVFHNREQGDALLVLGGRKELRGHALDAGMFQFELFRMESAADADFSDAKRVDTGTVSASGVVEKVVEFNLHDLETAQGSGTYGPRTYYFAGREVNTGITAVQYSTAVHRYEVTVEPDADGDSGKVTGCHVTQVAITGSDGERHVYAQGSGLAEDAEGQWQLVDRADKWPVHTNVYRSQGTATIDASKHVTGRDYWNEGETYSFELTGVDGAPLHVRDAGGEVTDAAGGKLIATATADARIVDFPDLVFTQDDMLAGGAYVSERTFTYNVHEVVPDDAVNAAGKTWASADAEARAAGGFAKDGVTYAADHQVTVRLVDDARGTLHVTYQGRDAGGQHTWLNTPINPQFVNTYAITGTASAELRGAKRLTGRDWQAGDVFTLRLEAGSNTAAGDVATPMPAGARDGTLDMPVAFASDAATWTGAPAQTKVASFGQITYTAPGTYRYRVTELTPAEDDRLGGITYAGATEHSITVVVADDGRGGLTEPVVRYGTSDDPLPFVNSYSTSPVAVPLAGVKTMLGRDLEEGRFTFALYAADADGLPLAVQPAGFPQDFSAAADGSLGLPTLTFDAEGTYRYCVGERIPDGAVAADDEALTFSADTADAVREAHTWQLDGVEYDGHYARIAVTVVDEGALPGGGTGKVGQLAASVAYDNSKSLMTKLDDTTPVGDVDDTERAAFTNRHRADGSATLSVAKELTGRDWNDDTGTLAEDAFAFDLAPEGIVGEDGNVIAGTASIVPMPGSGGESCTVRGSDASHAASFGAVKFDEEDLAVWSGGAPGAGEITGYAHARTFAYTITERAGGIAGVQYDTTPVPVRVTVTDEGGGRLSVVAAYGDDGASSLTVTNAYVPTPVLYSLRVEKALAGVGRLWGVEDSFDIVLLPSNGDPMPNGSVGQAVAVVDSTSAVVDDSEVEPGGHRAASFEPITFTKAGTYSYTVYEAKHREDGEVVNPWRGLTFDESDHRIVFTVSDNGEGTLSIDAVTGLSASGPGEPSVVFSNEYNAGPATLSLAALKTLNDHTPAQAGWDDPFEFELYRLADPGKAGGDDEERQLVGIARSNGAGEVRFDDIALVQGDLSLTADDGHRYLEQMYVVREHIPGLARAADDDTLLFASAGERDRLAHTWVRDGVTYDAHETYVRVAAGDVRDGEPQVKVERVEYGHIDTAAGAAGAFSADKVYEYDASKALAVFEGAGKDVPFANQVEPTGTLSIPVQKVLEGRDWNDGEKFAVQLEAVTRHAPMPVGDDGEVAAVTVVSLTGDEPTAVFGGDEGIALTPPDIGQVFEYRMREVVPDDAVNAAGTSWADASDDERAAGGFAKDGLTYDSTVYELLVPVSVNAAGSRITAEAHFKGQAADDAEDDAGDGSGDGTGDGSGADTGSGADSGSGDGSGDGSGSGSGSGDGAGDGSGSGDGAGDGTGDGSGTGGGSGDGGNGSGDGTGDPTDPTDPVDPGDGDDGEDEPVVGEEAGTLVFTNTYSEPPAPDPVPCRVDPPVRKVVKGTPTMMPAFTFTMTALTAGAPMPEGSVGGVKSATIVGEGEVEFGWMDYEQEGVYRYAIQEQPASAGAAEGWTYDTAEWNIVVTVTSDADGNLQAARSYTKDGFEVSVGEIVVENAYEKPSSGGDDPKGDDPKSGDDPKQDEPAKPGDDPKQDENPDSGDEPDGGQAPDGPSDKPADGDAQDGSAKGDGESPSATKGTPQASAATHGTGASASPETGDVMLFAVVGIAIVALIAALAAFAARRRMRR